MNELDHHRRNALSISVGPADKVRLVVNDGEHEVALAPGMWMLMSGILWASTLRRIAELEHSDESEEERVARRIARGD